MSSSTSASSSSLRFRSSSSRDTGRNERPVPPAQNAPEGQQEGFFQQGVAQVPEARQQQQEPITARLRAISAQTAQSARDLLRSASSLRLRLAQNEIPLFNQAALVGLLLPALVEGVSPALFVDIAGMISFATVVSLFLGSSWEHFIECIFVAAAITHVSLVEWEQKVNFARAARPFLARATRPAIPFLPRAEDAENASIFNKGLIDIIFFSCVLYDMTFGRSSRRPTINPGHMDRAALLNMLRFACHVGMMSLTLAYIEYYPWRNNAQAATITAGIIIALIALENGIRGVMSSREAQ